MFQITNLYFRLKFLKHYKIQSMLNIIISWADINHLIISYLIYYFLQFSQETSNLNTINYQVDNLIHILRIPDCQQKYFSSLRLYLILIFPYLVNFTTYLNNIYYLNLKINYYYLNLILYSSNPNYLKVIPSHLLSNLYYPCCYIKNCQ